jgi:hypothetical protein
MVLKFGIGVRHGFHHFTWICHPSLLSCLQALTCVVQDVTEMISVASCLGYFTDKLLLLLARTSDLLSLTGARNAKDPTGTTAASARPDCCVWHNAALVLKGEDKVPRHGSLSDACRELGAKMEPRWNVLTTGSVPFIVCYANCGAQLQFLIIMRDSNTPLPVSDVFNLHEV